MTKEKGIPQIRFSGFTDTWEQRKFSELTEIRSASRVHKEEWQSSGVPFYRSSDVMAALNGTENEKAFISEELYEKLSAVSGKLEKGDVLVTGGGSVGKPYIVPNNEPLYTKDADLLWIKNNENLDPYFVYTFFFSPTFTDYLNSVSHVGTIAHYTITQLGETPITLPCVSEQQKIGDYFRNLDSLITLHQRKYDKLTKVKKAMLEKMFPENGSSYLEIRFKGFTDAWEQRELGECFSERVESMPDGELISVTINDGIKKFSELGRHDNSNDDKSKYKKVCIGDIAYNSMRMWQGASGYSPYEGIVSPAYTVLSPNSNIYSKCVAYQFKLPQTIHIFQINSQGITSDNWNLKYPALSKIKINVSRSLEEQRLIAEFFTHLDRLITLHQRKLEKLKNIKKACLEKMFV